MHPFLQSSRQESNIHGFPMGGFRKRQGIHFDTLPKTIAGTFLPAAYSQGHIMPETN